jgi:hypothetical protein
MLNEPKPKAAVILDPPGNIANPTKPISNPKQPTINSIHTDMVTSASNIFGIDFLPPFLTANYYLAATDTE